MPPTDPGASAPARARRRAAGAPGPSELADRITRARMARGLTLAEAARGLGISHQAYRAREVATGLPYPSLVEMVEALGYDPAILCPEVVAGRSRVAVG